MLSRFPTLPVTLMRNVKILALLLLVALLAACAGGPPKRIFPPQASLQELRVQPDGQWAASIRIHAKLLQYPSNRVIAIRTFSVEVPAASKRIPDVVRAFERASGRPIPYRIVDRRPGDIAECWAEPTLARAELGWQAERGLEQMMVDTWRWQSNNPGVSATRRPAWATSSTWWPRCS